MSEKQKGKKFVFNGDFLLKNSDVDNIHQLSLQAKISAMTAYKYMQTPEKVKALDLAIFYALLHDGAGLSNEKIMNLKLSDLFNLVDVDDE